MIVWCSKVIRSLHHAFRGIGYALRTQRNLQIHLAATVLAVSLGFSQNLADWKWCCLGLTISLVWMAELFNSALEKLCDRVTTEQEDAIRQVKDMAAGAVLCVALLSIFIAIMIFS